MLEKETAARTLLASPSGTGIPLKQALPRLRVETRFFDPADKSLSAYQIKLHAVVDSPTELSFLYPFSFGIANMPYVDS